MSRLATGVTVTATQLVTAARAQTSGGTPVVAHIVRRQDNAETAIALVMRARVEGVEIEALCGHRWIPAASAAGRPVCEACRALYELHGDLGDAPRGDDPTGLPQ